MRISLTEREAGAFLHVIDRQRQYIEDAYYRSIELGFGRQHPLAESLRASLISLRHLCIVVNNSCADGEAQRYMKRAKFWGRV